jgi:hypothetical protein
MLKTASSAHVRCFTVNNNDKILSHSITDAITNLQQCVNETSTIHIYAPIEITSFDERLIDDSGEGAIRELSMIRMFYGDEVSSC